MREKQQLRRDMKARLKEMTVAEHAKRSAQIHDVLFAHPWWKEASVIGLTVSHGQEVDTFPIIERAWAEGKTVAVPRCDVLKKWMDFRKIESFSALEKGYGGIKEPILEKSKAVNVDGITLLLMPGLAFDKRGYRLGYGGGFYDRFLEDYHNRTMALSFGTQVVERVPVEPFDQPVNGLITEKGVMTF